MIADHVICTNCGEEMVVVPGTDVCPKCKRKGTLLWADEGQAEVEVPENAVVNLDDYENVVNETEGSVNFKNA